VNAGLHLHFPLDEIIHGCKRLCVESTAQPIWYFSQTALSDSFALYVSFYNLPQHARVWVNANSGYRDYSPSLLQYSKRAVELLSAQFFQGERSCLIRRRSQTLFS
jgi:hypothetical protein